MSWLMSWLTKLLRQPERPSCARCQFATPNTMIDWAKEDDGTINREWTSVSDETVAFVQRYPLFCVTADFGCVMFEAKK